MGLGSLMAGIGASLAGGIASAVKKNKNNGSGSSNSGSSGGGSSGGSSSGGGSLSQQMAGGFAGSAEDFDSHDRIAKEAAEKWWTEPEKRDYWESVGKTHNTALGRTYDSSTGTWSGGYERPRSQQEQVFEDYYGDEATRRREEEIEAANRAKVEQNVSQLEAQKGKIDKVGEQGNAAAQQAYMQVVNPNGGLAESLAARGLLTSGLTESSQIAAGNEYQNALNSNQTMVQEQLAEIDRAISNARLSGDLATAEQLQAWYDTVASAAMQNVQNIVSANQWQQQFDYNRGVTDAGLTGVYNGTTTMQGQAAKDQHETSMLEKQTYQENLRILLATGLSQAEAELEAARLANEGTRLQNQYYKSQM